MDERARRLLGYALCNREVSDVVSDEIENASRQIASATVAANSAGVDTTTPVLACADDVTVEKIVVLPQGDFSGIDGSNTCVLTFKVGGTTKATKTFTTEPDGSLIDMEATEFALAAEDVLTLTVTNGTTAASPQLLVYVTYTIDG